MASNEVFNGIPSGDIKHGWEITINWGVHWRGWLLEGSPCWLIIAVGLVQRCTKYKLLLAGSLGIVTVMTLDRDTNWVSSTIWDSLGDHTNYTGSFRSSLSLRADVGGESAFIQPLFGTHMQELYIKSFSHVQYACSWLCFQRIHDWTVKYEVEASTAHPGPENAFAVAIVPLNFRRI